MKKLLLFVLLLSSCKKAENRSCLKFYGDSVEKNVTLGSFHAIEINPNIIVKLIQDSVNFGRIKGGEKVINFVKFNIQDGILKLTNENNCTFLRNPNKKITVELHFVSIDEIVYQGSENVISEGVLFAEYLSIVLKETSGTLDLTVNTVNINVSADPSWANFNLSGVSKTANFGLKGNSYCNIKNLVVQEKLTFISRTVSDCFLNGATAHLKCETNGSGNIYYTNSPEIIEWNDYSSGKLLLAP